MGECYRDLFRNIIPFDTCYIDQSKIWGKCGGSKSALWYWQDKQKYDENLYIV